MDIAQRICGRGCSSATDVWTDAWISDWQQFVCGQWKVAPSLLQQFPGRHTTCCFLRLSCFGVPLMRGCQRASARSPILATTWKTSTPSRGIALVPKSIGSTLRACRRVDVFLCVELVGDIFFAFVCMRVAQNTKADERQGIFVFSR